MKKKYGKGFPRYTLGGAIKVVEEASKHGKSFTREAFAAFGIKSGTSSSSSGAYLMRLAALTDFKLITQSKGEIGLTDLALRIAHPESDKEREKFIQEAFLSSEIFSAIYNLSQKGTQLNIEAVGNMAVRQHNINPKYKDDFLRNLVASGEDAGLITKLDKQTIQFNTLEHSAEFIKKDQGEEVIPPKKPTEDYATEKHPVVNQIWGDKDFKIQLSIYSDRPLKAEEFAGIGEITSKIEELVIKLRQ